MPKTLNPNLQYHNLELAHSFFNMLLFDGQLPNPIITLRKAARTRGWFHAQNFYHRKRDTSVDEICLCPNLWHAQDDRTILSTLVHEMCHQWQEHFGTPPRKCYHDKEWADKMEEIGLMPSDTGEPGGKRTGQRMTHYIIRGGLYDLMYQQLVREKRFKLEWQEREELAGDGKPKKQTRVKWVCPGCEQAAWAKESAHLVCGDCEETLEPAE